MANEVVKPDFSYQWSSGGAIVAPSNVKIQTGWTAEVPPFQWENWSQNRQDNAILHLFQKGISEWDAASNYYFTASGTRSYVQGSDGLIYVAVADSLGQNPVTDTTDTYWTLAFTNTRPLIGPSPRLRATTVAATTTTTFTDDEVIVGSAIGGLTYKLSSFSKTINLSTVGAGGMDTGAAPVNGYVAIYAIYNPLTNISSAIAVNTTSILAPVVYSGVNLPSGYTASALLTVAPTNGSGQFPIISVLGRSVGIVLVTVLNITTNRSNATLTIASAVPPNATEIWGELEMISTAAANLSVSIAATNGTGQQVVGSSITAGGNIVGNYSGVPVVTQQTINAAATTSGAGPTFKIYIGGYKI